jgi:radical SAM superfamily enzyme YgiQ (UPF0313 family)
MGIYEWAASPMGDRSQPRKEAIVRIHLISPGAGAGLTRAIPMYPSGLQLLAALTPPEHEVRIIDEGIGQEIDFDEPVDLVGVTAVTQQAARAYEIAAEFSKRGTKVIMGGIHASFLPEEACQYCDAVCIGEAENVWQDILSDADQGQLKPVYHSDEWAELSQLPMPRRELSPKSKYRFTNFVLASRGCPFKCSFCSVQKLFGSTYRFRPVQHVVAEIRSMLKHRGPSLLDFVLFGDDNIVASPKYAKELFRALIPLRIKWFAQASVTVANDDVLLSLARQSGCVGFEIGFESVSDDVLKEVHKTTGSLEKYKRAIKKIHSHKIFVMGSFLFGFDGDTTEAFEATVRFIEQNHVEVPVFAVLTPLPGTEIARQFESENRMLTRDVSLYDLNHVLYQPKQMSPDELQRGYQQARSKISTVRSILKRVVGARTSLVIPLLLNIAFRRVTKRIPADTSFLNPRPVREKA